MAHIAQLNMALIEDGTYFVHEAGGELVACGGAQPGDDRLLDPASEPARVRAMFVRGNWTRRGLGRALPDGVETAAIEMRRLIAEP